MGVSGTFRVGALSSPGDPFDVLWSRFADRVAEESSGRLRANLFVRGEVGGEEALMLAVRRGRIEVSILTSSGLSAVIPEMALLMAPFMFSGLDEADFVFDHYLSDPIQALSAEKGIKVLGLADEGFLSVFSVTPIRTPKDLNGYRMRSRQVASSPLFLEALSADVVPLPFPELIPALQTSLVQGAEAGTMTYASYGLAPIAPFLTLTRHAYSSGIYGASSVWFDNLDDHLQSAVLRATPDVNEVRRMVRARNLSDLEKAASQGVVLYQPSGTEIAAWKEATSAVAGQLVDQIGGNAHIFYDAIMDGKAAYLRDKTNGH